MNNLFIIMYYNKYKFKQMNNFVTYKQFLEYVENNYEEDEQLVIEDFIAYYVNDYRGYGRYNCKHT